MHSFKKAAVGTLVCLLFIAALSVVIIAPAFLPDSLYNDSQVRAELAGTLDTIYCGASHGLSAFVPKVIDERIGTSSYNASGYLISFNGRKTILEKELARNPVKTVVLEIAYDAIRDSSEDMGIGEPMVICKLDSFAERLHYSAEYVRFFDGSFDNVYSMLLRYGLNAWKAKLRGEVNIPRLHRGYVPISANDLRSGGNELPDAASLPSIDTDFSDVALGNMREICELCRAHGAEMLIAVTPLSEQCLLTHTGWDAFHDVLTDFCRENGCALLDFNLYKERGTLLSDADSFSDPTHMGEPGSSVFSAAFADVLGRHLQGEDVSALFYDSYAQAIAELAK